MSKTQKNVGKKTFKKVAKKKVSKPSKKTGLKKKVVSMKLKRKVKKVHRKKMKRGGAKILSGETDLGKIWNTILLKKGKAEGLIEDTPVEGKNYVLFVIDMQNDFSDGTYKREGSVKLINNVTANEGFKVRDLNSPTTYALFPDKVLKTENNACLPPKKDGTPTTIGNFGVAGVNNSLIDNLVTKIKAALKDKNCTEIIFTRDYHPDGHMSFSKACSTFVPKYCTCKGGNFPVHCLQGHSGSRLIPAIETLLLDDKTVGKEKVRILFKGFDLNCDSFTAVPKDKDDIGIDNYASNQKQIKPCSTVSGAYDLVEKAPGAATGAAAEAAAAYIKAAPGAAPGTAAYIKAAPGAAPGAAAAAAAYIKAAPAYIKAAIDYDKHIISAERLLPYVDDTKFKDVKEFQVCGLAGDYCVRDTVVSLAKMFPDKQVTLLGGLTRYAVLPLFTMQTVPIHNYIDDMNVPNINGTGSVPFNKEQAVQNFNAIYKKDNNNETDKSLYYYTLTSNEGTYQLVQTTADGKGLTEEVNQDNFSIPDNQFFHFITPPEVIIEDYKANSKDNNIKIRLYTGDVGSRLPVLAVCDTKDPTPSAAAP